MKILEAYNVDHNGLAVLSKGTEEDPFSNNMIRKYEDENGYIYFVKVVFDGKMLIGTRIK